MLELIYTMQAKIAEQGTTIDNILALIIGLFVLIGFGYIAGLKESEKGE